MSMTLASLRERLKQFVQDSSNLTWSDAMLEEAIRLALHEYSLVKSPAVLNGLDGAGATSLPELYESALLLGAAGYAACSRALQRSTAALGGQESLSGLMDWGQARLEEFRAMLGDERANQAAHLAAETARTQAEAQRISAETERRAAEEARLKGLHSATQPPFPVGTSQTGAGWRWEGEL